MNMLKIIPELLKNENHKDLAGGWIEACLNPDPATRSPCNYPCDLRNFLLHDVDKIIRAIDSKWPRNRSWYTTSLVLEIERIKAELEKPSKARRRRRKAAP